MAGDVLLEIITHVVRLPPRPGQQVLQSVRCVVACVLSELAAVLAAHRTQQATDISPHPSPRLDAAETARHPLEEVFEFGFPVPCCKILDHLAKLPTPPRGSSAADTPARDSRRETARERPHVRHAPTITPLTRPDTKALLEY